MNLRLSLALTVHREVEITVRDNLPPGRLAELAQVVAQQMGTFDVATIRCVEELPETTPRQSTHAKG